MAFTKALSTMALAAVLAGSALGQTKSVTGVVRDLESRVALDNARIVFFNENSHKTVDSVFTDNSGFYNASFALTAIKEEPIRPDKLFVYQNFPNPFNPATTVRFDVPHNEDVLFEVFDIQGKSVLKKNFDVSVGSHELSVSGLGAAGVYFYRISSKDGVETKKMVQLDGTVRSPSAVLSDNGGFVPALNKVMVDQYSATASRAHYSSQTLSVPDGEKVSLDFDLQYVKDQFDHDFVMHVYDGAGFSRNGFNLVLTTQPSGHVYDVAVSDGVAEFKIRNEHDSLAVLSHNNPDLLKWCVVMPDTNNYFGVDNLAQSADRNSFAVVNLNRLRSSNDLYLVEKHVQHPWYPLQTIPMDSIEAVTIINGQDGVIKKFVPFNGLNQIDQVIFSWYFPTGLPADTAIFNRSLSAISVVDKAFVLPGNNKKLLDIKPLVVVDSLTDPYWLEIKNRGFENVVYTEFDANLGNNESTRSNNTIKTGLAVYYNATRGQMMAEDYQKFTKNADFKGGTGGWIFGSSEATELTVFGKNCTMIMELLKPGSRY